MTFRKFALILKRVDLVGVVKMLRYIPIIRHMRVIFTDKNGILHTQENLDI